MRKAQYKYTSVTVTVQGKMGKKTVGIKPHKTH